MGTKSGSDRGRGEEKGRQRERDRESESGPGEPGGGWWLVEDGPGGRYNTDIHS